MPSAPIFAEFGIVAPVGRHGVDQLLGVVADADDRRLPDVPVREWPLPVPTCGCRRHRFRSSIARFTAWHRSSETSRRLDDSPGVDPALATALVASVTNVETG